MGKLRINEIDVIVKTIEEKLNTTIKTKREEYLKNYKFSKQEKEFIKVCEEIKKLQEKRSLLAQKIKPYSYIDTKEGFLRKIANDKFPFNFNRQTIKNSIILKNIDPLFNVETFIENQVNELIPE